MIRLVICCGGGFSSSFLAAHVAKEIKKQQKETEIEVSFKAFTLFKKEYQNYDVAMLCPHLYQSAKLFVEEAQPTIPLYMIPPLIYGTMRLQDLLEDAQDILAIFNENHVNLAHFPGEENALQIKRQKSYRRSKPV